MNKILEASKEKYKYRRRIKLLLLIGLILIIFVATTGLIINSSVLQIKHFEFSGNSQVSSAEIENYLYGILLQSTFSRFLGFNNFLIWPNELSSSSFKNLPIVEGITFSKDYFSHTLSASVLERQPFGIWCQNNQVSLTSISTSTPSYNSNLSSCYWFDENGVMFKPALASQGNLILVVSDYSGRGLVYGDKIVPDKFISNLFSIFEVLQSAKLNVKEIDLNNLDSEEIDVYLNNGPELMFSLRFDDSSDLSVIDYFINKQKLNQLQYIDFRSQNRALYR